MHTKVRKRVKNAIAMAEMKLIHATKSKETSQTTFAGYLLQSVQFILYHLVKILIAYTKAVLIPTLANILP